MSYPKTYHAWRRTTGPYPHTIQLTTETLPDKLGANDVLLRIHTVGLNYRDVAMLQEGKYPVPVEDGGVSASDCAAEVVAFGSEMNKFVSGDHVAPTVDFNNLTGERSADMVALGGNGPGMLREYAVFEEKVLAILPKGVSWDEVR
jgi:NADPH:quinone reductase-like Zn-dependent oxidoreductase